MDGNADVHGKTIRETMQRHQQLIVSTYFSECEQLAESLSKARSGRRERRTCRAQRLLRDRITGSKGAGAARHDRMPYRVFFGRSANGSRRATRAGPMPI